MPETQDKDTEGFPRKPYSLLLVLDVDVYQRKNVKDVRQLRTSVMRVERKRVEKKNKV